MKKLQQKNGFMIYKLTQFFISIKLLFARTNKDSQLVVYLRIKINNDIVVL